MKTKTIAIIIGAIIIIGSIGLNLYWIGWKQIEMKIYERGATNVIQNILSQLKTNNQVIINLADGQVILVPKQ